MADKHSFVVLATEQLYTVEAGVKGYVVFPGWRVTIDGKLNKDKDDFEKGSDKYLDLIKETEVVPGVKTPLIKDIAVQIKLWPADKKEPEDYELVEYDPIPNYDFNWIDLEKCKILFEGEDVELEPGVKGSEGVNLYIKEQPAGEVLVRQSKMRLKLVGKQYFPEEGALPPTQETINNEEYWADIEEFESDELTISQDSGIPNIEEASTEGMEGDSQPSDDELEKNMAEAIVVASAVGNILKMIEAGPFDMLEPLIEPWKEKLYEYIFKLNAQIDQLLGSRTKVIRKYSNKQLQLLKKYNNIVKEKAKDPKDQNEAIIAAWQDDVEDLAQSLDKDWTLITQSYQINDPTGAKQVLDKHQKVLWKNGQAVENPDCNITVAELQAFINGGLTPFTLKYFESKEEIKKRLIEMLNLKQIRQMIEEAFKTIIDYGRAIFNGIKGIVSTATSAFVEPMGAMVVTTMGPGAVATNLAQIRGVFIRVGAQASALMPLFGAITSAAIFLHLPASVLTPLNTLATLVATVKAICSAMG